MKINYKMDISENSLSINHTPMLISRNLPFYLQSFGCYQAGSGYFTEREGFDSYLLIHTLSGGGNLKYKTREYTLEPFTSVIFNCNQYQYYKTQSDSSWEFRYVHFNGAAAGVYDEIINGEAISVVNIGKQSQFTASYDEIYRLSSQNEVLADVKICNAIMNILTEMIICRNISFNRRKYSHHKTEIDKVLAFIHQNYNLKITLDSLASLVHMSKYHFLRLFRGYVGTSPYEYLLGYRVNMAKAFLKETEFGINEISLRIGFGDVNNFIRYFKRLTGTTPSAYRKYWIQ